MVAGGPTVSSRRSTFDALHLVERFTRVAPDVLNYEAAIDDPKTFTRPFKLLLPLTTARLSGAAV